MTDIDVRELIESIKENAKLFFGMHQQYLVVISLIKEKGQRAHLVAYAPFLDNNGQPTGKSGYTHLICGDDAYLEARAIHNLYSVLKKRVATLLEGKENGEEIEIPKMKGQETQTPKKKGKETGIPKNKGQGI